MLFTQKSGMAGPVYRAIAYLGLAGSFMLCAVQAGAATLTVTTLNDVIDDTDGVCSLREAINNVEADSQVDADCAAGTGDDVITFDSSLFSGTPPEATITLSYTVTVGSGSSPAALTIMPPADHRLVLQGSGSDGVLSVQDGASPFLLQDVDIQGGRETNGAGARVETASARFLRVHFVDNVSPSFFGGGAVYSGPASPAGSLRFEGCRFEGNSSTSGDGGAIHINTEADFDTTITDAVFVNNTSSGSGGAVHVEVEALAGAGTPELNILSSRFEGNTAGASGGGGLTVWANDPDARIDAQVADSLFHGNHAPNGGALQGAGNDQGSQQGVIVRRGTFVGNTVDSGGSTLYVQNMDLGLENNLFASNEDGGQGVVRAVNHASTLPRAMDLVANSFHHNQLSEAGTTIRPFKLTAPSDAVGWEWRLAGNLFNPDPLIDTAECVLVNGDSVTLTGGANISPEPGCVLFAGDLEADPEVALATTADVLKPRSLLPQTGSPAVDLWAAGECLDLDGATLAGDLRGEPRPRDGDGVDGADCESGAFELPDAGLLSVSLAGTGGGAVVSDPAGIDCGGTCSAGFAGGSQVTLVAAAQAGSVFSGWSGDCTGTADCVIQIDGDMQVTATFDTAPSHMLDMTLIGDGGGLVNSAPSGIYCDPSCAASFADGTEVTLTASQDASSVFDGWSGGGCSGTGDCVVTLASDASVTAEFTATQFPVNVGLAGSGNGSVSSSPAGIACPDDCEESFARTEIVTLTASPESGSAFSHWEGDCSGNGDCVLDMDGGPYTVTARFELLRTLSVGLSGGGSGTVTSSPAGIGCPGDCNEVYLNGTTIDLTAVADAGSAFAGWSDACSGTGACSILMDADESVTAIFQTGSFSLDVTVTGPGTVTSSPIGIDCPGDCSESYLSGTQVELTAAAVPDYVFAGWSGDCAGNDTCIVTVDQARSVEALFVTDAIFSDHFESR